MPSTQHVRLGRTEWLAWPDALLRSTGFPASGLLRFAAGECAQRADDFLAGRADRDAFATVFEKTVADISVEVNRVAADPSLREAIAWQNPAVVGLLDSLLRNQEPIKRNAKRRYREVQLSKFWQRYSSKAETIGFFGPSLWITLDPERSDIHAVPGPRLIDKRRVFLEPWAVVAYGEWLTTDEEMRRWLPPARHPHHFLERKQVTRPGEEPAVISEAEFVLLRACNGKRPAALVAQELCSGDDPLFASTDEVFQLLDALVERKLATWDANVPLNTAGAGVLDERIAAIGDPRLRDKARSGFDRLKAARDGVARAAGDPAALEAAQLHLSDEFTEITGRPARRRGGVTYGGRGLCYEDTTRDLELSLGRDFIDDLAAPMSIVLQATRWLTVAMSEVYEQELRRLYKEHSPAGEHLTLGDIWPHVLRLFFGSGAKAADGVTQDFIERWTQVLGLNESTTGLAELRLSADALAQRVRERFPASAPGWDGGRVHSPDLHICASSPQAVNDGDYVMVLGEMHAAAGTMEGHLFGWSLDDPASVVERLAADQGKDRIIPLFPKVWPRNAGRTVPFEHSVNDTFLAFSSVPGADLDRTTSIAAIDLSLRGDRVWASMEGREFPLVHVLSAFLSMANIDALKLVSAGEHTPRISVDRLVLFRETWRTTAEATDLLPVRSEAEEFLAARRWRQRNNLPERCFVKISTETKPFYVDLTSPLFVSSLGSALRAARKSARENDVVSVTVTEMLPAPEQAWVPGPDGESFFGEVRMHIVDPEPCAQP
ncbi:lantibiotic dehydratase [Streptomyces sp. NPDC052299]|uniref:lantibiotic dehydratase n=1 Tax=Streptomyces sp. NPDC052299 TaxID=3155054 RepID=UPI0034458A99